MPSTKLRSIVVPSSVRDLGVELQAEELAPAIADDGEGARLAVGEHLEARTESGHLVPVRHPDDAVLPHASEQIGGVGDVQLGPPILGAFLGWCDRTPGVLAHPLQAIADAEHRHALLQDGRIECRGVVFVDRARATAQDHGLRPHVLEREHGAFRHRDARIDRQLADAACDQLAVLGAEVDDEDAAGRTVWHRVLAHASPL
jgi:hypothetical protein